MDLLDLGLDRWCVEVGPERGRRLRVGELDPEVPGHVVAGGSVGAEVVEPARPAVAQEDDVVAGGAPDHRAHGGERHQHRVHIRPVAGDAGVDLRVEHVPHGDLREVAVDVQLEPVTGVRVERVRQLVADVNLAGAERAGVEAGATSAAQRPPDAAEAGRDSEHGHVLG